MASARSLQKSIPSLGRFWYHFWPYIRNQSVWLISCAIALLADVILRLLEPWPLKFVFDHVLIKSSDDRLAAIPFVNTFGLLKMTSMLTLKIGTLLYIWKRFKYLDRNIYTYIFLQAL